MYKLKCLAIPSHHPRWRGDRVFCEISSMLLPRRVCFRDKQTHEAAAGPHPSWLQILVFPQVLIPGLVEGSTQRKRILSPEELEDRRKKRQEAAAKRKRLIEEKKRKKEEAEHKKKYVLFDCIVNKAEVRESLLPSESTVEHHFQIAENF